MLFNTRASSITGIFQIRKYVWRNYWKIFWKISNKMCKKSTEWNWLHNPLDFGMVLIVLLQFLVVFQCFPLTWVGLRKINKIKIRNLLYNSIIINSTYGNKFLSRKSLKKENKIWKNKTTWIMLEWWESQMIFKYSQLPIFQKRWLSIT